LMRGSVTMLRWPSGALAPTTRELTGLIFIKPGLFKPAGFVGATCKLLEKPQDQ
jgi:hypothetical protein